ncbi:MAG: Phosphate-import protein PhnD [Anaerolineales bacterium]|nr:Phosphate-import protein PhnD [Anaerolineales bacterium]
MFDNFDDREKARIQEEIERVHGSAQDSLFGLSSSKLSRRTVLRLLAASGLLTLGDVLAACAPAQLQAPPAAAPTAEPAATAATAFDPKNPTFPVTTDVLLDAGYETGTLADLERMQESPRDEPRYGSPVCATPTDESELIDPDTIEFAVVPTEDPALYRDTFEPLLENMRNETGKEVRYNPLSSYAAQVEAMRSERLHVAGFSTGTVPFAVNLACAVPFSIQVSEDGAFGYRLWLITQADNDAINGIQDLAGKTVAHADPTSNSGNLAPRALFTNQGVKPDEDYEVVYSGGHEQSALGVFHGDYDAAPVCSTCYARVVRAGQIDGEAIKVVWASDPFPTTGFSYRYNLRPELQEGIRATFLDYDYSDTGIAEVFEGRGTFIEIDYATVWDIILQTQESLGVEYETGELEG